MGRGMSTEGKARSFSLAQLAMKQHDYNIAIVNCLVQLITEPTIDDIAPDSATFPTPPFNVSDIRGLVDVADADELHAFAAMFNTQVTAINAHYAMCRELDAPLSCTEFIEGRIDAITDIRRALAEKNALGIPTRIDMLESIYGQYGPTTAQKTVIGEMVKSFIEADAMDDEIDEARIACELLPNLTPDGLDKLVMIHQALMEAQSALHDTYNELLASLPKHIKRFISLPGFDSN